MLQRLDCPYLTSAWKETRAGSHCQPVRHNPFSSSSMGYGANRLPPQLCAPPLRAFRAHTPFVQVYSDRLLFLLIPLMCYGHVSPHPHYSFWNGSLSALQSLETIRFYLHVQLSYTVMVPDQCTCMCTCMFVYKLYKL